MNPVLSAFSFSASPSSMQVRGLTLMNSFLHFGKQASLRDFQLPVCDSNTPDGQVPASVKLLDQFLRGSQAWVLAVPESGGHYSASFKNVIDWFIVQSRFNSRSGQGYGLSNKDIYLVTFTPSNPGAGDRHFPLTRFLLEEKMGARVQKSFVFNSCWEHLSPENFDFVSSACQEIKADMGRRPDETSPGYANQSTKLYDPERWMSDYQKWDAKWKT